MIFKFQCFAVVLFAFECNNKNFYQFVIHDFLREWGVRRPSIMWCEGSRSVSHALQFIDWIICLFCLNIFRNTCTWVFSKRLLFYFYFKLTIFFIFNEFYEAHFRVTAPGQLHSSFGIYVAAVVNCWHYWVKDVEAKLKFNLQLSPQN